MSRIRVYEAAKKLNMETKELLKILNEKGVVAKSPISFIEQSEFDNILESMTGSTATSAEETGEGKIIDFQDNQKEAGDEAVASAEDTQSESEELKLALVPPPSNAIKTEGAPEPEKTEPGSQEQTESTEQEPVAAEQKAESAEPEKPAAAAPQAEKQSSGGALSYIALGLAVATLIAMLALNSNINQNTALIESNSAKAAQATALLEKELGVVGDGVRINQDMIFENQEGIDAVNSRINEAARASVKGNLEKQSTALKELVPSVDGQVADKILDISNGLSGIATSL